MQRLDSITNLDTDEGWEHVFGSGIPRQEVFADGFCFEDYHAGERLLALILDKMNIIRLPK